MRNLLQDVILKINIGECNGNSLLLGICMFLLTVVGWLVISCNLTQIFNRRYCSSPYAYQCTNLREVTICVVGVYHGYIYIYIIFVSLYLIYGSFLGLIIIANLLSEIPTALLNIYMGMGNISKVSGIYESGSIQMLGGAGGVWVLTPLELYTKGIRFLINTNTTKYSQFIHDKIILHQLKQVNSNYKNIEIIHMHNFYDYAKFHYCIGNCDANINLQEKSLKYKWAEKFPPGVLKEYYRLFLSQNNQHVITDVNWSGVPDAVFFNKNTQNMTTVQYKSTLGEDLRCFSQSKFGKNYDATTHVMSILLKNPEKYTNLINIINEKPHDYDIWLRLSDNNIDNNILQEMEKMNDEFMKEQGDDVLRDFYRNFHNKDYSKFQADENFLRDFYECMKFYDGEQNLSIAIKNTKPDI